MIVGQEGSSIASLAFNWCKPQQLAVTMSFGDIALSRSRFIFWCLAPVLFLCGVGLPLMLDDWTPVKLMLTAAWSVGCFAAIFALYDARRFPWAVRTVTGIIFLACVGYLIDQLVFSGKPLEPTRRSEASPWNSIVGFIVIGFPALWYTILGRFSLRKPEAQAEQDNNDG
jgi:hypothetical protein